MRNMSDTRNQCNLHLRKVDADLVHRLKVLAVERGQTLVELCMELLESAYAVLKHRALGYDGTRPDGDE